MNDKLLTFIIIGKNKEFEKNSNCDKFNFIYMVDDDLLGCVALVKTKYIAFIDSQDSISDNYFNSILNKITNNEFDACYINNKVNYDYINPIHISKNYDTLISYKPTVGCYIWSYIYSRSCLLKYLLCDYENLNNEVNKIFNAMDAICDIIYFHNIDGKICENNFYLLNRKNTLYYKNIIYVGSYCDCLFNGYVSWLIHIGRAFSNKYKITILYDNMPQETYNRFNIFFNLVQYNPCVNYLCDNLSCTYSTYFFPLNLFYLVDNCIFIHGNTADFKNSAIFKDDIYTRYIAVSKTAAQKAIGYYPTENIEYIYNPYVLKKDNIKPHLRLVSAQRNAPEKRIDRIVKIAHTLTDMGIPYTWNVFMDSVQGWENEDGLIYRGTVLNTIDYINDADYVVVLSDSESYSYTMVEALSLNVKVICTEIEICEELGIINGKNSFIIPKEYFDDGNEEKLKQKLLEAYKNKDMKFKYEFPVKNFQGFNTIFKK